MINVIFKVKDVIQFYIIECDMNLNKNCLMNMSKKYIK